jgi:hypothetical protein
LERRALTATGLISTIHVRFEGVVTKGFSPVDEEALMAWQDVLDAVAAGRPSEAGCPFCNHRPLTIEEVEFSTRISCGKCKKFIQGRFNP